MLCSAADLALKSLARFSLCCCSASSAFRCTVSASARLSPRRGTRSTTLEPRRPDSQLASSSALDGKQGTSTSRGTGLADSSAASSNAAWSP
ncbi:Uncharacterised protein [Mycobacterium tuberculosis]|uniref:Uncharacterized protein n=1 Tax=Mycobacterium tuberculosis TaxID=1773 RepID=A0A654U3D4_MYCTX|nr:Uncharacterised protein [Mycobacterium tuberculosis]CKR41845.1 Uncharacterised protein [Mycobacterium tuberculosis]CKS13510.1 Uncharacterised protein [Mycobacterium tuberculosis]CKT46174.1 Uncharacterised protein [Mycobacterium tuberculosis]CKT54999.1 Uncharacterised protein [Mycobacterium tuberculosis]